MYYDDSDSAFACIIAVFLLLISLFFAATSSSDGHTGNVQSVSYQTQHQELLNRANTLNEAHTQTFGESFFKAGPINIQVNSAEEAQGAASALKFAIYKLEEKLGVEHTVPKPTEAQSAKQVNTVEESVAAPTERVDRSGDTVVASTPTEASAIANGILRSENEALKAQLAEAQAQLEASQARSAELEETLTQIVEGLKESQAQLQN